MVGTQLTETAESICVERPDGWEYRLTLELLQTEMRPVLQRWDALRRGLYSKPALRVARDESVEWMLDRLAEVERITGSFTTLSNEEFATAWGQPGEPGDPEAIIATARLFAEMCETALHWEEAVRFAKVDSIFKRVRVLFVGVGGRFIDEAAKLPLFMAAMLGNPHASGSHELNMILTLPDGWAAEVKEACEDASAQLIASRS